MAVFMILIGEIMYGSILPARFVHNNVLMRIDSNCAAKYIYCKRCHASSSNFLNSSMVDLFTYKAGHGVAVFDGYTSDPALEWRQWLDSFCARYQ